MNVKTDLSRMCLWIAAWWNTRRDTFACTGLFGLGLILLGTGLLETSFAQIDMMSYSRAGFDETLISCSVDNLFQLIEGSFGALVMVVSGLGAIIAAAMGAYRACVGMLVVAVGSFILRSLVSLFFGSDFEHCDFGG